MKCRNSRIHSEETKTQISKSILKYIEKYGGRVFSEEEIKNGVATLKAKFKRELLEADFNSLSSGSKRKRVIIEQEETCFICKNTHWLNEKIVLELDHIDGNNQNNERINLRAICPNCHALTGTWRGKNKKCHKNRVKVSDEELLSLIVKYNFNFRQALLEAGLAAKGGNYNRCKRLSNSL